MHVYMSQFGFPVFLYVSLRTYAIKPANYGLANKSLLASNNKNVYLYCNLNNRKNACEKF